MSQNTSEKTALPRLFPSCQKINILKILPREGTKLTDTGSFVIMDRLGRLLCLRYTKNELRQSFPLQIFIKYTASF